MLSEVVVLGDASSVAEGKDLDDKGGVGTEPPKRFKYGEPENLNPALP